MVPQRLAGHRALLAMVALGVPVVLGFIAPVGYLLAKAIERLGFAGFPPGLLQVAINTVELAALATVLTLLAALAVVYAHRLRPGALAAGSERIALLGYALPGTVLGIGLRSRPVDLSTAPAHNFVFLIDVSGSMDEAMKLPLVKQGFDLLVKELRGQDRVAIVVYAGSEGLLLPSTPGSDKKKISDAIAGLSASGSTAGEAGIRLAYKIAKENWALTLIIWYCW
jgi:hypothetical protein